MEMEKKYRYPGINFFTKADADIFCGRADDAQRLFNRTMLNNTIVLHGDSGAGKSSLIRAGLIPLLEKQNEIRVKQGKPQYLPITIGLDAIRRESVNTSAAGAAATDEKIDTDILVKYTLTQINTQAALRTEQLPFIGIKQHNLWYTAKLFERNKYTLLLLFDQFEELQGFSPIQVSSFTEKLAALFASTMPDELYDEYDECTSHIRLETMTDAERAAYNDDISFIEEPLSVRLLFSLREDRLGTMSMLSDYFPDILKNDFFLQSLPEKNARQAISEPCTKPGNFVSPLFSFEPAAVDAIIESLKVKQRQKGMYDPIELQIVCRRIEKKVIETGINKITVNDLPPVENAVREFYDEKWDIIKKNHKLTDKALLQEKKHFIEKLVVNRKRNPVLEDSLVRNEMDRKIAADLVAEGLVRIIPSGNDRIYQLCHDRFVEPMVIDTIVIVSGETSEEKARQRRKTAVFIVSGILLLGAALLFYTIYKKGKKEEEDKMLNLTTTVKRAGNSTLSYVVSSDWLKKNPGSEAMKERLQGVEKSGIVYLTGVYPAISEVRSAEIGADGNLLVKERYGTSLWATKNGSLLKHTVTIEKYHSKSIQLSNGEIRDITEDGDSILLTDRTGARIAALETNTYSDNSDACLSPDGNYLFANDAIYEIPSRRTIPLPSYKVKISKNKIIAPELTAIAFVSNESYVVAYEDGCMLLYNINRKNNFSIRTIDTIRKSVAGYESREITKSNADALYGGTKGVVDFANADNRITSLRTDSRHRFLLALNSHKDNDIYRILKKQDAAGGTADSIGFRKQLEGTSNVLSSVDFSQDGSMLLSGGNDGITVLWNLETMQKISTLKVHNGTAVTYTAFTKGGKEIITATSNDIVYTWSMESPLELYKKDRLYRFASFNYEAWYMNEKIDGRPRSTATTEGLYTSLLHNVLNMPFEIEYMDDRIYSDAVKNTFDTIKAMHAALLQKKDYRQVVTPEKELMLSKFFYKLIATEPVLLNKEHILGDTEKGKLAAKLEIVKLQQYFFDTINYANRLVGRLLIRINGLSQRPERLGNFTVQADLLRFYEDTVLKPAMERYPDRPVFKKLMRTININWFRNYLFSGNMTEAGSKAAVLATTSTEKFGNDSIYLVIYHIAAGNTGRATTLYKMLQTKTWPRSTNNRRTLVSFLRQFSQKNMAAATVAQFKKEFPDLADDDKDEEL
jgi:WD40 repeat protein